MVLSDVKVSYHITQKTELLSADNRKLSKNMRNQETNQRSSFMAEDLTTGKIKKEELLVLMKKVEQVSRRVSHKSTKFLM